MFLVIIGLVVPAGCSAPPAPPEVEIARLQELELRGAEAHKYAPNTFLAYEARLKLAREGFLKERDKLLLRDYESVAATFKSILADGNAVLAETKKAKLEAANSLTVRMEAARDSMEDLQELSEAISESRIPRRHLVKAELALSEARSLLSKGKYSEAAERVKEAEEFNLDASRALKAVLGRYADGGQIRKWREMVSATVSASRASGGRAIVVNKLERSLVLYERGSAIRTYRVGLGRNGSSDKLLSGDHATPEGRYRITKKNPASHYHKALLINYPNDEDRAKFARARRSGSIPAGASIGGLVEIHGGGSTSVTRGCVAMDNGDMDDLYSMVSVGTPVTIVGATEVDVALNAILGGGK